VSPYFNALRKHRSIRVGLINFYGWIFGLTAITTIPANVIVQMYVVFHPDFIVQVRFRRSKRASLYLLKDDYS
jgi:hypothetical protein